jgi:hypothetical protein
MNSLSVFYHPHRFVYRHAATTTHQESLQQPFVDLSSLYGSTHLHVPIGPHYPFIRHCLVLFTMGLIRPASFASEKNRQTNVITCSWKYSSSARWNYRILNPVHGDDTHVSRSSMLRSFHARTLAMLISTPNGSLCRMGHIQNI